MCLYVDVCVYVCICMYVHIYVYMYMCMYVYIYVYHILYFKTFFYDLCVLSISLIHPTLHFYVNLYLMITIAILITEMNCVFTNHDYCHVISMMCRYVFSRVG